MATIEVKNLHAHYHQAHALRGIHAFIERGKITAIIGPANAGKSTFLRCLNRTAELVEGFRWSGEILIGGQSILSVDEVPELRRRIGLVAPLPVGLPMSILDNVTFAPRMAGVADKHELAQIAEKCLRDAALWDEVQSRLGELATKLSGGQQQRLSIARALSHDPEILCLDEFSIAIDPVTTARIEDVLRSLNGQLTVVLVTNLVAQAKRLAGHTIMFYDGLAIEDAPTEELFANPKDQRTRDYVEGRLG